MIPTTEAPYLGSKAIGRALRPYLGREEQSLVVPGEGAQEASQSLIVTIGKISIAVLAFPFPIPHETISSAVDNELIWRDGRGAFINYSGHIILTVLNPMNDPYERFDQAWSLTVVTAAVLSRVKGRGVFWQAADCLVEPVRFLREAKEAPRARISHFASALWFSFRFFPGSADPESDLLVCQSTGLTPFLGRELECGPYPMTPFEIWSKVLLAARFMAGSGPVFADGHTLGLSGEAKPDARLHFDWSTMGGVSRPIFQLRLLEQERVS